MTDCDNFTRPLAISHFIRPSRTDSVVVKNQFFDKHPIQPCIQSSKGKLGFKRIYFKILPNNETIQRKWISYSTETCCLYCSACMAYGSLKIPGATESKFILGYEANIKVNKSLY